MKPYIILSLLFSFILSGCTRIDRESDMISKSYIRALTFQDSDRINGMKFESKLMSGENNVQLEEDNLVSVQLEASGFCPGDRYKLYNVNMLCDKTMLHNYVVNSEGQLENEFGMTLDNTLFCANGCLNGEYIGWTLLSEDKKTCLTAVATSDPIHFSWNSGAYAAMAMISSNADMFIVSGKGFQPHEKFIIVSETCGERIEHPHVAGSNGKWFFILAPAVINRKWGTGALTILREPPHEIGKLDYIWGEAAIAIVQEVTE